MSSRNCIYSALIIVALSLVMAFAGQQSTPQAPAKPDKKSAAETGAVSQPLVQAVDADGDGFITREEWDLFFVNHDEDKDDRLSMLEIQIARENVAEKFEKSESLKQREALFRKFDRDQNNTIARNEWPASERAFRILDANRDGMLTKEEFLSVNGRYWNMSFEDWDADGDRLITRDEWLDNDESFKRLDSDGNGVIDRKEFYIRT
jgi:Ca2+-binding EF-hand superfamily protein